MTHLSSAALRARPVQPMRRNRNSVRLGEFTGFGPVSNAIVLVVFLCTLGILYVTQVTKTNSFGYQIRELKTQKSELSSQKQQLEIDIARLQSRERIAQSPSVSSLVDEPAETVFAR